MTKRLLFTPTAILYLTIAFAQNYGELHLNEVRARFYSHGLVGLDLMSGLSAFELPINSGSHPLYSAGLWIGGTTANNQARVAAMMQEVSGQADYYPGPLTTIGANTDSATMAQFDRVWVVTREEVGLQVAYGHCLLDPNCDETVEFPGYTIPQSILEWPAMNNTPGFDTYLAPFYDMDADAEYIPANGDAPCILGDQAGFFVFNDKGGPHMLTGSQPIGIEVQAMPFVFKWDGAAMEQTVFIHYRIINRGTLTLNDVHLGFFMDPDLGCSEDDMMGSDPTRNLVYAYNGDAMDEDCLDMEGYGTQPPAFGLAILRGLMTDYNGLDDPMTNTMPAWNGMRFGDTVTDNERHGLSRAMYFLRDGDPAMTGPQSTLDFMNFLHGQWKDGAPLTYGGSGHGGTIATRFAFPDGTDPLGVGTAGNPQPDWSETTAGNAPGDRRALSIMGPRTLEPGQVHDLFFALVYARASSGGPGASVQALRQRVDSVRSFLYNNPYWGEIDFTNGFDGDEKCMTDHSTLKVPEHMSASLALFPNPASEQVGLALPKGVAHATLRIQDAMGRTVATHRVTGGMNHLALSTLAKGVYFCEVRTPDALLTGRLVKQ